MKCASLCILLLCLCGCSSASRIRPGLLGAGVAVLPKHEFDKIGSRDLSNISITANFQNWASALRKASGKNYSDVQCNLALVTFLPQVDSLWNGKQFQSSRLDSMIKRLQSLPPESVQAWRDELNKLLAQWGSSVDELEMIGYLIQLDGLFDDHIFSREQSETMMKRLRSLDPKSVENRAKTADCYSGQAAIMLIQ